MPSTQLQNSCVDENSDEMYKNKKKRVRAKHAKLLFFTFKYANLLPSCLAFVVAYFSFGQTP